MKRTIKGLLPASFSFVMATGIVAIATHRVGFPLLDRLLLVVAAISYALLLIAMIIRTTCYWQDVIQDFQNPLKAPGFFTIVAASSVLGSGLSKIFRISIAPELLWYFAALLYTLLVYSFLFTFMTRPKEQFQLDAINGAWLLLVVGLQSLAVLGAVLFAQGREFMLMISILCFLLGSVMYFSLVFLVVCRLLLLPIEPKQLVPTYWIMMGASAISTLAGSEVSGAMQGFDTTSSYLLPFVQGGALTLWAAAISWIPLLILLGFWRHGVGRVTFGYEVGQWSIVFPLGMFTAASHSLGITQKLAWLSLMTPYFCIIAVSAWLLVSCGMLRHLLAQHRQFKGIGKVN